MAECFGEYDDALMRCHWCREWKECAKNKVKEKIKMKNIENNLFKAIELNLTEGICKRAEEAEKEFIELFRERLRAMTTEVIAEIITAIEVQASENQTEGKMQFTVNYNPIIVKK